MSEGRRFCKAIFIVGSLMAITLLCIACGSAGKGGGGSTTTKKASGKTFTNENYGDLVANPDGNEGARVDITGKVFTDPEVKGNQAAVQIFADPKNSQWNTIVRTDPDSARVKRNDYVHVTGEVAGSFEGKNAFGASLQAVEVKADNVDSVDPAEAIDPTKKSVTVGQTQQDQGFSITVDKIDFGANTTRVYLTVTNGTNSEASFYTYSAKLIQGSRQIDPESSPGYDLPKPQSDLAPGVKTQGAVVFGGADPASRLQLTFTWSGRQLGLRENPLIFKISPR